MTVLKKEMKFVLASAVSCAPSDSTTQIRVQKNLLQILEKVGKFL